MEFTLTDNNTTEWVEENNWATLKKGDRVRLVKGDDEATVSVVTGDSSLLRSRNNGFFKGHGWKLFVVKHEKSLPTEPGLYLDYEGDPWVLDEISGIWRNVASYGNYSQPLGEWRAPADFAPFTRLEPQAETVKKVLARLEELFDGSGTVHDDYTQVAAEFGVTE